MTTDILMAQDNVEETHAETRNQLEQFTILAKTAHGAACLELIKQVLEAPGIYVFAELLAMPNIAELQNGPNARYYNTLNLFAYGTYKQYSLNPSEYLELTTAMRKKLQHLTIVSLAIKNKCIPYSVLLEELEVENVRHLEDVIIEAIYADIIHGKLFQNNRFLEIDFAQGRDIPPGYTSKIANTLQEWSDACDAISKCIEEQINRANSEKAKRLRKKERIDKELINLKKTLKTQLNESDDVMQTESRESSTSHEARKKSCKSKSARPSGSFKFSSLGK
ncbi:COP9 signalosome complex subunit 7 [Eupeodes corollae]|uniref:COP9 signalosome complex subunit 7 n=1 Tax=Eupeodes corollae TaxID=290404 RepID=UPI00248F5355|nr:COP9 signalosome complex subunit 7 [Eupeodes corollae]XP_055920367.1 COP9 signalosome complex subunit 7 [Eupeodes corollae]